MTVVAPGEGEFLFVFVLSFYLYLTSFALGKGGPALDWDKLVDRVFTDEIAKLF